MMKDANGEKAGWQKKVVHEINEYFINFVYLAVFFGVFTLYRSLIMAEYQVGYLNYGFSLIEALVLAKLIMIGDILGLGRGLEDRPLIYPTLYKSFVFVVWVACFIVFEHMLKGFLHGKGLIAGFNELLRTGWDELLARCLVTFFAFIPFFAVRELERVLGEGKIRALLFRKRAVTESDPFTRKPD